MQQYADIYLLLNYCTCFGCLPHPSSGVHKTVTAASGTGHNIGTATSLQRGQVGTPPWIAGLYYALCAQKIPVGEGKSRLDASTMCALLYIKTPQGVLVAENLKVVNLRWRSLV